MMARGHSLHHVTVTYNDMVVFVAKLLGFFVCKLGVPFDEWWKKADDYYDFECVILWISWKTHVFRGTQQDIQLVVCSGQKRI